MDQPPNSAPALDSQCCLDLGYYLELFPDSFVVGSAGPDRRQRSEDDVRLARFRGPKAAHLQPGFSPPAPPPSGAKASAIRGAKEAAKRND